MNFDVERVDTKNNETTVYSQMIYYIQWESLAAYEIYLYCIYLKWNDCDIQVIKSNIETKIYLKNFRSDLGTVNH